MGFIITAFHAFIKYFDINYLLLDCGKPENTGYDIGTPLETTYQGRVSVDSCDTGYKGEPSVDHLNCKADGYWSEVTGCQLVGKSFKLL